jgi:hypothetical protein
MATVSMRYIRSVAVLLLASTLTACGGGGGGGDQSTATPSPKSISGGVILGPIAGADVEVSGTSGSLVTGMTGSDGSFGPLTYSGSYTGPLRITVTGNALSTWTCDSRIGCFVDGFPHSFGDQLVFDGVLEAVLPSANASSFVSVSMLSNLVAARTDALGGLTSGNVNSAYSGTAAAIRSILTEAFNAVPVTLPDNFASIPLLDLANLPAPGGDQQKLGILLSLLNSGFATLNSPDQTTGEFIDTFSSAFGDLTNFPVAGPSFPDPSQESFLSVFLVQSIDIYNEQGPLFQAIDGLLAPTTFFDVIDAAFDKYISIPSINVWNDAVSISIDDVALAEPITRDVGLSASNGTRLQVSDIQAIAGTFDGLDWLSAEVFDRNGDAWVRVTINNAAASALSNGQHEAFVEVTSTNGSYMRDGFDVWLNVNLVGRQVYAGDDQTALERTTIMLQGSTSSPNEVSTISWVQTGGTNVAITDGDTFTPSVELPSVPASSVANLRLDVEFNDGQVRSDTINIFIDAYPNIADVSLPDATLQQCITDTASVGDLIETGEVTNLACSGVADVSGLGVFALLTSLELPANTLTTLGPILQLDQLQYLDISGNSQLPCDEIDQLAERLEEGTELIVADTCLGGRMLDLGSAGFDASLDEVRNYVYVSIPTRNEVAAISLTDARIVDRYSLPGTPYGIDLSLDGTRIFAALNGSNAVAVINIEQRTVSTIDLGVSVDHPTTYDVLEGETDRLFVTANPGSSGFAHVAQVLLDQGNIASSVAGNDIIRARPVLARSPDLEFVYVGSGFSPNSLYKLSLMDPNAPIVLEDDHGSVSGTDNLAVNLTGTRIALGSGQVLRTGSFVEEGRVTAGRSVASPISNTLFVAAAGGEVEVFDFDTLALTDSISTSCDNSSTGKILVYNNDVSFVFLQSDMVCLHAQFSRTNPPDPYAALRFPDLAFEECVIDAATTFGLAEPGDFTTLDCSAATRTILGIDGIDRFVNLETLDFSNSSIADLSPLANLPALTTLALRDANVSVIDALFDAAALTSADLTNNPGITCSDLDSLVAASIAIQANVCADTVRIELGGIAHDMALDLANDRVFVSIPSLNRISEVDLGQASVANTFALPANPYGIDLANDGQTIYAALHGVGDLAVLDSVSGNVEAIDLSVELDDDRTWDVAEVSTNRVVVSTNPGSNGLGYIVEVRRDLSNATQRVASTQIIRASPVFTVAPDETAVYVGAGFSPNSLYRLDATQSDMPIVAEDDHGNISGTNHLAISPDGERIYLTSGQVVSTATIDRVGQFPAGRSVVTADGASLLVADASTDAAREYDIGTTGQIGTRKWGCDLLDVQTLREYGDGVIALGEDLLCFSRTVPYP